MSDEVEQIKDRINIADIIGQYVQLRRAGRSYTAKCPFHSERTPSFHVSPERGTYMCFGCGEKGDVFSFIQKMDGVDFPTALKQLAEKAGVKLTARTPRPQGEVEKEERLRQVVEAAIGYFESQLGARADVREYVKNRGLKEESITTWRLGYAPATWESLCVHLKSVGFSNDEVVEAGFAVRSEKKPGEIFDRFRGRIIFPIFDTSGTPIAVSGRFFEKVPGQTMEGEPAKYVNSPETPIFKKSRVLYGLNVARGPIRKLDCILLVEGQFDLLLSHQSGLPFAVALSGTALTDEHLAILGKLSKRLVLALDADAAGIRAGLKSAYMAIRAGFDVKIPVFPNGQDPADVARENPELLKAAIRTSKNAVEFFLDALRPQARDERAYRVIVESHILPLVAAVGSRIEQEQLIRFVSQRLGVSDMAVRAEVEKRPEPPQESGSPEIHQKSAESILSPLEKKIGMLLFSYPGGADKLKDVLGEEKLSEARQRLEPMAEDLRHYFDREVHDETTVEAVGEDMLGQVSEMMRRAKMKSL